TALISPLSDITDTIVIDGNATVSGTLSADKIKTPEATITTLYADTIISKEGNFGDLMTSKIASLRSEIQNLIETNLPVGITSPTTGSSLLTESTNWLTGIGTTSATIHGNLSLTDNLIIGANLAVNGQLAINQLNLHDNIIESSNSILHLQPSGTGTVNILNNTLIIADNGSVTVNGDLAVSGKITTTSLFANLINIGANRINSPESTPSAELALDVNGALLTNKLNIATASATIIASDGFSELATSSAKLATNATAGTATLPAGKTEVVIQNRYINPNSMVYLTPAGSTGNQVIYLKSKAVTDDPTLSTFSFGIDTPLTTDTNINWWIIN
ncbi:hypothetical protein KBC75_05920, partial [Candidatus Shapirobacteria bacterium]|nr:hypothetical protein [Candidatus Shapirobacteria bacterium]